jgi:archaemetzincin
MGASPPPRPVSELHLVPIGPISPSRAEDLAARLSRRVSIPCHVDATLSDSATTRLPDRDQLDADALLKDLEARAEGDAVLVGLTPLDMGIPIFTFVFGRARQGGRAAVVSLARLEPDFYGLPADAEKTAQRTVNEVLHELGHVASLRHCENAACLMRFAASVDRVDVRGSAFCQACAARLPRWLLGPSRTPGTDPRSIEE